MKGQLLVIVVCLTVMVNCAHVGAAPAIVVLDHGFALDYAWTTNGHVILINRTSTFTQDDSFVYAYVKATFYRENLTWNWYAPSGQLYRSSYREASCVASPCDELTGLRIQGTHVSVNPGIWRLDFIADGSLIYTDYFRLSPVITQYNYWNFTIVQSSPPRIDGSLRVVIHPSNASWSHYQIYMPYAFNVSAHDYATNRSLQVTSTSSDLILVDFGEPRAAGYSFVLTFNLTYLLDNLGGGNYAFTWREDPWERLNDIHAIPERFIVNLPKGGTLLDVIGYNSISLTYNATSRAGLSLDLGVDFNPQRAGWTVIYRERSGVQNNSSPSAVLNSAILLPIVPLSLSNLSLWAAVMSAFLLTASELLSRAFSRTGYGLLINRKRLRLAALLLVAIYITIIASQLATPHLIIQH
jgi:hypothetical protein